jgi:four helix bundle protein
MPLIYESSVFKLAYDALKDIHLNRRTFSKAERYSLGESLERSALDMLMSIIEAGQTKNEWKIAAIDAALKNLEKAKILARLANDLGQTAEKRYIEMESRFQTIGRMLGGWRRSA